jgi:hypothetical protein
VSEEQEQASGIDGLVILGPLFNPEEELPLLDPPLLEPEPEPELPLLDCFTFTLDPTFFSFVV